MARRIMIGVVMVAVLVTMVVALASNKHGHTEPRQAEWVPVQPPEAARELLVQGVIDGQVRVDVVAPFEGVVKSVAVSVGDTVDKGAVLLEIGTSTLQSQIIEAKAAALKSEQAFGEARNWKTGAAYRAALRQVTSDQLNEADAERKLADTQRLFDKGIVARDELQQGTQALLSARSQLANSLEAVAQVEEKFSSSAVTLAELEHSAQQARLAKLEAHVQASVVRAPIAGVVTLVGPRNPESFGTDANAVGNKVSEGALIARVVDTTRIQVLGSVVEATVGLVKIGQQARISPVSQPGLVLEGRVSRVSALPLDTGMLNPFEERRTAKFQIAIEAASPKDAAGVLPKLGTNAEVAILLAEETEAGLLVPLEAVSRSSAGEHQVLARRNGQQARLVVVRLGATTAQSVHVHGLAPEDEVHVANANSPAAPGPDNAFETPPEGLRATLRTFFGGGSASPN